ncbi:unnamed protein product [marine sediment metagenome]|uniref:PD-(D/E)XK endonuclease-like domain-containing protein n=1 Tax=marine sediment metagenome TaxID=412755 RepID=X0SRV3_9ZZZZ
MPIKSYLEKIPTSKFPHHIFKQHKQQSSDAETAKNKNNNSKNNQSSGAVIAKINNIDNENVLEQRASQLKIKTLKIKKLPKNNLANKLAELALNLTKNNKERHKTIQNFFLINDSTTIATEIPVYLTNDDIKYFKKRNFKINIENYRTPVTGHIDILQIRNGLIHILDYKPDASKISPVEQLTIYALALASRTKLDLHSFKCTWFDENNYYEFYPLHAVYLKRLSVMPILEKDKRNA